MKYKILKDVFRFIAETLHMPHKSLWLILFAGLFLCCKKEIDFQFEGKWQSLNDPHTVIEFTPDQKIILYRDSISFWSMATKYGELNFKVSNESDHWYTFDALDGDEIFFKGRIETVEGGRIRIYYLKHHHILDLSDEYSRTNDFHSFDNILSGITGTKDSE